MTGPSKKIEYNEEFKRDAVDFLIKSGRPISHVAKELGVSHVSLKAWRDKYINEEGSPQQQAVNERLTRLEQENAELREERDILKKSMAIFLKPPK